MVKTKTSLDQTQLNAANQTPYMDIESEKDKYTDANILKAKAVVMIDPLTGRALGASDFFLTHQADALLNQANPVSTTYYPVLPATANVRIISMEANITWGVTQPTDLRIRVTIDGQVYYFVVATPVSANVYNAAIQSAPAGTYPADPYALINITTVDFSQYRAFLLEGKSVQVDVAVTWAVTQPTPMVCRVKWAKR